ncbi:DUF2339 domain-containing protein [Wohlfahrtiimonas populi]|uniref:DUF2339 domain-containing protein n=1 Tax=Wohlfahrtiimonas populi TaxID=1940240 RepID=UPI00098D005B|nr:DUF2339 domain-containing protein [Wohlfahrtiimonas populi]
MGEILIFIIGAIGLWLIFIRQPNRENKNRIEELTKILDLLQYKVDRLEKELKEKQLTQPTTKNCYDQQRKLFLQQLSPPTENVAIPDIEQPITSQEATLESFLDQETLQEIQMQVAQELTPRPAVKQIAPTVDLKPQSKSWIQKGIDWLSDGNVPVKVGMLILLFGVGALLKYALDQSWFTMTHALLLTSVAASGAFVFAYYKRESHRLFSLTVQGGSIGVLLLTLFTAGKIEELISLNTAFAGSCALIVSTAVLSVRQNAIALAIFAIFSGFMAPIWLSSGSNNYIALFSYYTLLNLGIIAIAWFKPWQKLNLLGFIFTFGVGITWGVLKYTPQNFSTTEPFLILFFVLYLIIPIFYANRMKDHKEKIVDAFLVFGNPLIALSIQAYLLEYSRSSLTLNAFGLALIYCALAYSIRRITDYRLLKIAYTALFWLFVILAIPLAFAAKQTGIIYTLFGTMLFWWAEKSNDAYTRAIAILFHILSVFTVIYGVMASFSLIAYTANFIALAFSAFFITYQCIRHQRHDLEKAMLANGLFFWLLAGILQILDSNITHTTTAISFFFAGTALIIAMVYTQFIQKLAQSILYPDLTFGIFIVGTVVYMSPLLSHLPLTLDTARWLNGSFLLGYLFIGLFWLAFWVLREEQSPIIQSSQLCFWCISLFMLCYDFNGFAHVLVDNASQIQLSWVFVALPLIGFYYILTCKPQWLIAPFEDNRLIQGRSFILSLIAIIFFIWIGLFHTAGKMFLLPIWLPIFNAYDLAQILLIACVVHFFITARIKHYIYWSASLSLIMITLMIVRTCYFYLGLTHWSISLLFDKNIQIAFTIIWTLLGFTFWVYGSKKRSHLIWNIGAALMGLVLLKLLLIDRSNLGNVTGIISFIGYGLFCLVIGYLAPQPPKEQS